LNKKIKLRRRSYVTLNCDHDSGD